MSDLPHPLGRRFDEANRRIVNDVRKMRRARAGDAVLPKGAHFELSRRGRS